MSPICLGQEKLKNNVQRITVLSDPNFRIRSTFNPQVSRFEAILTIDQYACCHSPCRRFFSFLFLFFSYLWSFACSTTITGLPCEVTETTGTKLPGICVPLDNNGHNLDCEALFSFLVLDVCLENYGESMQNVYLSLLHPSLILLGMDHPRWCRGVAGGNPGNPENPESQDTCINMPISTHSSVTNLLHSSAYRSAPTQTPTDFESLPVVYKFRAHHTTTEKTRSASR